MIQNKSKTRQSPNSPLVKFSEIILLFHQSSHTKERFDFSKSIQFTLENADTISFFTEETCQLRRTAQNHTDTHEKKV